MCQKSDKHKTQKLLELCSYLSSFICIRNCYPVWGIWNVIIWLVLVNVLKKVKIFKITAKITRTHTNSWFTAGVGYLSINIYPLIMAR